MKKNPNILNQSEWIIMDQLWTKHPQTITQLFHTLSENPGWSKSTVNTLLGRMTEKGCIGYEEGKKAKLYYPKIKKADAATAETENLIERVYHGSVSLMMSTLVKKKNFSKEEIKELYDILKGLEENHD
ncbi:MAG: BlaI/MecI/CopY family transcriptional regulator [Lachnospiraceae bacterium]|nr:BlaI/MecI/CopY family transcriptional regulator [Lachnospiraceae bacterium]